jgi:hypothetical protein
MTLKNVSEYSLTKVIIIFQLNTFLFHEFIALLISFHIEWVTDIRSFPVSRRYQHINKEAFEFHISGIKDAILTENV